MHDRQNRFLKHALLPIREILDTIFPAYLAVIYFYYHQSSPNYQVNLYSIL